MTSERERERNFRNTRPLMGSATDHHPTTRTPSGGPIDLHTCQVRTCVGVSAGKGGSAYTCPLPIPNTYVTASSAIPLRGRAIHIKHLHSREKGNGGTTRLESTGVIAHSPAILRRATSFHGIPWAAGDRPLFNAVAAAE